MSYGSNVAGVLRSNVAGVSLQINVAPMDIAHATSILPHQLRQWAGQVDEVLFTLNLGSRARRGVAGQENAELEIRAFLEDLCKQHAHARIDEVDYSAPAREKVSEMLFGGRLVRDRDYRGTPFYPFFYGLASPRHDYVLHMDSDMLFGGGSRTWVAEAVEILEQRPNILVTGPLPGPPTDDGVLPSHAVARHVDVRPKRRRTTGESQPPREDLPSLAYRFPNMSGRIFLMDRARLVSRAGPLRPEMPGLRGLVLALVDRNPPYLLWEEVISRAMRRSQLVRVDFLGSEPGMWSLHPPYRSDDFYRTLPHIVERIEAGDIPEGQRGDFDINESLIDWTSAREELDKRRFWRRWKRAITRSMRRAAAS